ncbi:MAG: thymidylate synthase [Proteobacteria bacterium]|nr:thymidylate synthase [Pseudomonadota bacterium]
MLRLTNPRARLSRTEMRGKIFSCLGEFLWYMRGSNELSVISYYLPKYEQDAEKDGTLYGAYGPRLFGMRGVNQIINVVERLRSSPNSRRAVIELFSAEDLQSGAQEIPCTCVLQVVLRKRRLHMIVYMRSNDAFKGLPHDIFSFTMLQELIARSVNAEIGSYKHVVGSLHLYRDDVASAKSYLQEGWQSTTAMPKMPSGDPWKYMVRLLEAEEKFRQGSDYDLEDLPDYWGDLVRLLKVFSLGKNKKTREIAAVKRQMKEKFYNLYVEKRLRRPVKSTQSPQFDLLAAKAN